MYRLSPPIRLSDQIGSHRISFGFHHILSESGWRKHSRNPSGIGTDQIRVLKLVGSSRIYPIGFRLKQTNDILQSDRILLLWTYIILNETITAKWIHWIRRNFRVLTRGGTVTLKTLLQSLKLKWITLILWGPWDICCPTYFSIEKKVFSSH
jgi:hypothetical protein